MAITGVHVSCSRAGMSGNSAGVSIMPVPFGAPAWAEEVTSAGPGTQTAPANRGDRTQTQWVFCINAAVAAWVSVGPGTLTTPASTNSYYIPAGGSKEIGVNPGDGWAWAAA